VSGSRAESLPLFNNRIIVALLAGGGFAILSKVIAGGGLSMRIFAAALLFISSFSVNATIVNIDFEDYTGGGGLTGVVESGGFTFTTGFSPGGGLIVFSPGLISGDYSLTWCPVCGLFMEAPSGTEFSLSSFDTYALAEPTEPVGPFTLTGHRGDGSTVVFSFPHTMSTQTVNLGGDWTGLIRVEFTPQYHSVFGNAIDNISVNVVPIPAAVWLFGSGLGLLGWFRRRQG
jgi:hypothetical protein